MNILNKPFNKHEAKQQAQMVVKPERMPTKSYKHLVLTQLNYQKFLDNIE